MKGREKDGVLGVMWSDRERERRSEKEWKKGGGGVMKEGRNPRQAVKWSSVIFLEWHSAPSLVLQ